MQPVYNDTKAKLLYRDFESASSNPFKTNYDKKLLDIDNSKLEQLKEDKVELQKTNDKYSLDDGKISSKDKLVNFVKGIITPLTTILKSPKNMLIGAASFVAVSALSVATGGAIAPILVTIGLAGGGIQFAKSAYKALNAKTDEEAKKAWQGIGSGTSAIAGSIFGAKTAAKNAGITNAKNMNHIEAVIACIKNTPKAINKSFKTFTSGEFLVNLGIKKPSIIKEDKNSTKNKTEENKTATPNETSTEIKKETKNNETAIKEEKVEIKTEENKTATSNETSTEIKEEIKTPETIYPKEQEKQIKSLAGYKNGADQDINQGLRMGKVEQDTLECIQDIDSMYNDIPPLSEDTTLYRGIKIRQDSNYASKIKNLKVGDILSEDAYLSTSSDIKTASEFSRGGYQFKIKVPKGSKVIDVDKYRGTNAFDAQAGQIRNEHEFLLQRGSKLKITKVSSENGKNIIEAEYVGSTPKKVEVINTPTPAAKVNFEIEKFFSNPDAASNKYMSNILESCIKEKRNDDVKKIIEIAFDRAKTTSENDILRYLINPADRKATILKYFDSPEHINEFMPFIERVRTSYANEGCIFDQARISVNASVCELKALNEPLSSEFMNLLAKNDLL